MMGDVTLHRLEELLLRTAYELRPALAGGDPPAPLGDCGLSAPLDAVWRYVARPSKNVDW
jgi:hypothetical protein